MISVGTAMSALLTAVLVIAALAIHESAHILAANYLGARVDRVRPFFLGFAARISNLEQLHAWERYVIYGAGSLANGFIAAWAFTVSHLSYVGVGWLEQLALYNFVLSVFNLLPVLPLDGGRIIQQFLGNRIGVLRANRVMLRLGQVISIALIALGFLQMILYIYNITLLCAGVYIRRKNKDIKSELQMEFFRAMQGKTAQDRARQMPVKTLVVTGTMSVKNALERLTLDHYMEFCIKDESNRIVTETALIVHVFTNNLHGVLGDIT